MKTISTITLYLFVAAPPMIKPSVAWSLSSQKYNPSIVLSADQNTSSRKSFLARTVAISIATLFSTTTTILLPPIQAASAADLNLETAPSSGISWADAKVGTGTPLQLGNMATVDYVLSTTGARYGSKIYASGDTPYRWKLGDGSTIAGLEYAIVGNSADGIPPLLPGGIRRIIIPQKMAYDLLGKSVQNARDLCVENGTPGPIPPPSKAFEEYQRFKNIYCNPNRQYQPDIVMDIKLYGARTAR